MRRLGTGLLLFSAAYFVLLELMLVAAVLYWPNFEENVEALRAMAAPIPALRDIVDQVEETGVVGYIAGQHFFKGCNTLGTAAAVLFAVGAVAGEAHRGTLEIWLARPYSRARILTERYVAGMIALAVPIFLSSATIPFLAEEVGEYLDVGPFLLASVHQLIFLMVIYGLSFLCSTVGSHPIRIAVAILFLTIAEFAIYMIKVVTHYSFYRLADIEVLVQIETTRSLDWGILAPLLLVTALMYVASLALFQRRVP